MRYIYSSLSIYLFLISVTSCGNWFLPPLEINSLIIENNIIIVFSAQPSEESIKKAFSLTEDGQTISGSFSFSNKTVVFNPLNSFRDNYEYIITISTIAEDRKGNSLLNDFIHKFYTKQDIEDPRILNISPINESNLILSPDKISIVFSKSIDIVSFDRAISINPSISYVLEWNTEYSAVDIIPLKPLIKGTRYTLTINTLLTDIYRNAMLTVFKSTFLYGLDMNPPEINIIWQTSDGASGPLIPNYENHNIPSSSDIIIKFDKQILIDAIAGFIEINPPVSISITPNFITKDSVIITLNNIPRWNNNYSLKLKKGITDTFGNKTESDLFFPLFFNKENYRPILFSGGILKNNLDYIYINSTTDYSAITFDVTYFDPSSNTGIPTELYYAFRISNEADSLSLVSAMQAISISTRNSCAYISIRTMNFLTSVDSEYNIIHSMLNDNEDGKLCILKIGIDIENRDNRGLIIFSIRNSISDNLGNTIINPINITLNKQ